MVVHLWFVALALAACFPPERPDVNTGGDGPPPVETGVTETGIDTGYYR